MTTSSHCETDEHEVCSHRVGETGVVALHTPGVGYLTVELCDCGCHDSCPLRGAGRANVREGMWRQHCTCPGAPADWAAIDGRRIGLRNRRSSENEIIREVRKGARGRSPEEVRSDLLISLHEHGVRWPQARIDMTVNVITASTTGNRLLVVPRLFGAAVRGFLGRARGAQRRPK
jgi:hypothetical protein